MAYTNYVCNTTHYSGRLYQAGHLYSFQSSPGANFTALTEDAPNRKLVWLYEETGADGTIRFPTPQWDDMTFPATGINPPGAVSDPSRDTSDGNLVFAAAATNLIAITHLSPHSWVLGSEWRPHVHVSKEDANEGDVVLKFEYSIAVKDGRFPAYTVDQQTFTMPTGDFSTGGESHTIFSFDPIDMSSYTSAATAAKFRFSRIGGDAADDYAGTLKLLEFDVHIQNDSLGSGQEFIK